MTGKLDRDGYSLDLDGAPRPIANGHGVKGDFPLARSGGPGGRTSGKVRHLRPDPDLQPVSREAGHRRRRFERTVRRGGDGVGRG